MLSRFCRRTLLHLRRPNNAPLLQNPNLVLLVKLVSSTTPSEPGSFTLSYLINSCGLSPESASSVSKYVQLQSPTKPDAVIDLFKNHGFSQKEISTMIRKVPKLLLANPEKTLLPKLEYMYSLGISQSEVVRIVARFPWVFMRSLEEHIIPSFNYLRDFFKSHEKAVGALKRDMYFLSADLDRTLIPNITTLEENGVDYSKIAALVNYNSTVMLTEVHRFHEIVQKVKELGFKPEQYKFIRAIIAHRQMSKLTWKKKIRIYRSWGWSEESIQRAFLKDPFCMKLSEDKIMAVMGFLVNEMRVDSCVISQMPSVLKYSLEERIIPRCLVYKALVFKGLINREYAISTLLNISNVLFKVKFLNPFQKQAPELQDIYERKVLPKHVRNGSGIPTIKDDAVAAGNRNSNSIGNVD